MNKQLKAILYIVMISALLLMIVCFLNYLNLSHSLTSYERQLSDSRETWERIASEKEEIQADLKARQKELKEAQLSLDESTERIEEHKTEIDALRKDIETLRQVNNP